MPGRCFACFCPADFHVHFTSPHDTRCGTCGPVACPAFVDPASKGRRLTPEQRRTREIALERIHTNTIALAPFARSGDRIAAARIPAPRTAAAAMYERRDARTRDRGRPR